jgi:hypothetical protein
MPTFIKLIPLFSAILATGAVFYIYGVFALKHTLYGAFVKFLAPYRFLSYKWGFDTFYNQMLNRPLMEGAYNITFSLLDKGVLEVAGPTGLGRLTILLGRLLTAVQTGRVYDYAGFMLVCLCVALFAINITPSMDTAPYFFVGLVASVPNKRDNRLTVALQATLNSHVLYALILSAFFYHLSYCFLNACGLEERVSSEYESYVLLARCLAISTPALFSALTNSKFYGTLSERGRGALKLLTVLATYACYYVLVLPIQLVGHTYRYVAHAGGQVNDLVMPTAFGSIHKKLSLLERVEALRAATHVRVEDLAALSTTQKERVLEAVVQQISELAISWETHGAALANELLATRVKAATDQILASDAQVASFLARQLSWGEIVCEYLGASAP